MLAGGGCTTTEPPETGAIYSPASFDDLPGWQSADARATLDAFQKTCPRFSSIGPLDPAGPDIAFGHAMDWRYVCDALRAQFAPDEGGARHFVETWFRPYTVEDRVSGQDGLFTGYYEPELNGSLTRHGVYRTPLYGRPDDLVTVDLGQFRETLKGQSVTGQVVGGRLKPYPDRSAIDAGGVKNKAATLAWVDDPVAAFFMEIQGSGRIRLDNGSLLRLGYESSNGLPYTAIGKTLIETGALQPETTTAPAIRAWLADNPDQAAGVMESNRNYVFFKINHENGPVGAAGQILAPEVSLAVDRKSVPLGALVYVDADPPMPDSPRWQRLMVAQDTGGAIKGSVRGDVFFGAGESAALQAGNMKSPGRYWVLVPVVNASQPAASDQP